MSYIGSNLMPGEQVIYRTRRHFMLTLGAPLTIAAGCAVAAAVLFYDAWTRAGWVFVCLGLLEVLYGTIVYRSSEFSVTNRRVMIKTGLLSTKSWELLLPKIEGIQVQQSLAGRLNDFGSIIVTGTGGSRDVFEGIAHPFEFRQAIDEQIERRSRLATVRGVEDGSGTDNG
jgi:uncharacterized membrane protein YdbT with pleckstrin-like domain